MGQLLLIALATFASEDLTCLATGALIAGGKLGFLPGLAACTVGIFVGDLLLYALGRFAGRPLLHRFVQPGGLDRASSWLSERGASVVILSRFTPGLRLPTYVAAGALKTRTWTFAVYFLVASFLWTPLLVGAAAVLGRGLPRWALMTVAAIALANAIGFRRLRLPWQTRRRIAGWFGRKIRWEFWPPWLTYIPVVPYILYLGVKHRCLTLFTAANPGIPSSGFVGESKAAILSNLTCVPKFRLIPANLSLEERLRAAQGFASFPVVLKPNLGERGTSVLIARSEQQVRQYLETAAADTILQEYVGGLEFGIFYYRYPGETTGRIFSITEKRFPEVTGDGRSTVTDLVLRDDRAVCLAHIYLGKSRKDVPAAGERVRLVEIGAHCRGTIFLNGARYETPELLAAVDTVAKSHPGFFFGRFDIRTPSVGDLEAGRFQILELNGVTAEPTHIYDPSVSLREAYRAMFGQWRIAFEIGALNHKKGAEPMRLRAFLQLALSAGTSSKSLRRAQPPSYDRHFLPVHQQHAERT